MVFINSTAAMNSILQYRDKQPKPFSSYFPSGTSPLALDLISKMLQFHPDDRISVEHALEHPYLAEYHIQMPEPNCKTLFNFEFEKVDYDLSSAEVQHLMYEEMLLYRPTATQYPPYVRNQNAHPDTSNTMELAGMEFFIFIFIFMFIFIHFMLLNSFILCIFFPSLVLLQSNNFSYLFFLNFLFCFRA